MRHQLSARTGGSITASLAAWSSFSAHVANPVYKREYSAQPFDNPEVMADAR